MTRCECAGVTFAEIDGLLASGQALPAVLARTGCGEVCTACRPDLDDYLAARRRSD
jgi:bacterioferritin-associated ferredoxin